MEGKLSTTVAITVGEGSDTVAITRKRNRHLRVPYSSCPYG